MDIVRPKRKPVSGPLTTWPVGPIAGMVFWTSSRQPRLRTRVLRRKRRRRRWLRQQSQFYLADKSWGHVCSAQKAYWTAEGLKRHRTSYQQFMSINISRLLDGKEIWYGPEDLKPEPPEVPMTLDFVLDVTGDKQTTSTEWEDIDSTNLILNITVPPGGRRVKITLSGNLYNSAYAFTYLDLRINAVRVGGTNGLGFFKASTFEHRSITYDIFLNAGAWAICPMWRLLSGTSYLQASALAPAVLDALQVPL